MKTRMRARALVRDLGGPTAVQNRLKKRGHKISLKAVNAWVSRRSVPGDWLAEMAKLAREDGWSLHLEDYTEAEAPAGMDSWLE